MSLTPPPIRAQKPDFKKKSRLVWKMKGVEGAEPPVFFEMKVFEGYLWPWWHLLGSSSTFYMCVAPSTLFMSPPVSHPPESPKRGLKSGTCKPYTQTRKCCESCERALAQRLETYTMLWWVNKARLWMTHLFSTHVAPFSTFLTLQPPTPQNHPLLQNTTTSASD
jgi:hypothetical protein